MEWGYGSPSSFGVGSPTQPFDWGYGSPTPDGSGPYATWPTADAANEFDTGYGAPYNVIVPVITFGTAAETTALPANGGVIIKLSLSGGNKWPVTGPYQVRLIDPAGVARPTTGDCYSGVPGQGSEIFTDVVNESLSFVLPPLSPAVYDVRVRYGPTFALEILLDNALIVADRNYSKATTSVRRVFPPYYKVGPIDIFGEET